MCSRPLPTTTTATSIPASSPRPRPPYYFSEHTFDHALDFSSTPVNVRLLAFVLALRIDELAQE